MATIPAPRTRVSPNIVPSFLPVVVKPRYRPPEYRAPSQHRVILFSPERHAGTVLGGFTEYINTYIYILTKTQKLGRIDRG